ncbi:MAG TPA: hypothetical protein VFB37_00100 [Steroidobacteraceae bacterium]|nr:hypothetical protein [Steroidobacteraceae bacterium]
MSEFVAAMALFIPLVLGIIYIGKFSDIRHQAIQASRYAAMERALDPRKSESDTIVQNETVARFFRDGGAHNIAKDEQAQGSTATDENPNWSQITGDPLIAQYSDISVKLGQKGSLSTPADSAAGLFKGLGSGSGVEADVEVPVVNVTHFAPLANINLKIGATTVMAGDPWNGDGAADVASHQSDESVPGKTAPFQLLKDVLTPFVEALIDTPPPQFGCVKPEVVPKTGGLGAPGAVYNPLHDPGDAGDPNDFCYN